MKAFVISFIVLVVACSSSNDKARQELNRAEQMENQQNKEIRDLQKQADELAAAIKKDNQTNSK